MRDVHCNVLFVVHDLSAAYSHPDAGSSVLTHLPKGLPLSVNWPDSKRAPRGWLKFGGEGGGVGEVGWIRQSSLVSLRQFRKVIRCWPIKHIVDDDVLLGDYEFSVALMKNGQGNFDYAPEAKISVYMFNELVFIGSLPDDVGEVFSVHYDAGRLLLKRPGHGYFSSKVDYHTFSASENCRAPVVAKK